MSAHRAKLYRDLFSSACPCCQRRAPTIRPDPHRQPDHRGYTAPQLDRTPSVGGGWVC